MSPTEMAATADEPAIGDWPDMEVIRAEANANMAQRADQI